MPGVLALVGGGEWTEGCDFDRELLEVSGASRCWCCRRRPPTSDPEKAVEAATRWFESLGASVRGLMVLRRPDADDEANAAAVRESRFIYLGGGSPLHLRSVLKDTAVWSALEAAWQAGATLAGSSAGAMVLGDPMVDPRGGAYTLGLGLVEQLAVIPHHETWSADKTHRTMELAPAGVAVVGIDERTAAIRDPAGAWRTAGVGAVDVFRDGNRAWASTAWLSRPRCRIGCLVRSVIVTDSMVTFSFGSPERVPMASMVATTSRPFTTLPNSEYCGGRRTPSGPLMTKNWLPLVFGPGVGHGQRAELVAARRRQLVLEAVAGAAPAGALGVAALEHEAGDDAVEDDAVVVVVAGQHHEVVDRLGGGSGSRAMVRVPFDVTISAV